MKNSGIIASGMIAGLLTVFCLIFLSACFTDWDGGYGGVSVNPNGLSVAGDSDSAWLADKESLKYTVILKRNGKEYYKYEYLSYDDFVALRVPPGTWDIELWVDGNGWTQMMRGIANNTNVKAGIMNVAEITRDPGLQDIDKFEREFERTPSGGTIKVEKALKEFNKNVILQGKGAAITVKVTAPLNAPMFKVGKGGSLTLQNVTLDGNGDNVSSKAPLVEVAGGNLVMGAGSTIKGNINKTFSTSNSNPQARENSHGGGVRVIGGTFTMNGGEISGNQAFDGAGVKVNFGATFTMNGGKIIGNDAVTLEGNLGTAGGVHVWEATFNMKGGEISKNTATKHGGGVYIGQASKFSKTSGAIYGTDGDVLSNKVYPPGEGTPGVAVYAGYGGNTADVKCRELTASANDNLSYDNTKTPVTWNGLN